MKHVVYGKGDVARIVFLPGDPARVGRIAKRLTAPRFVSENREFALYRGKFEDCDVSVCSTGIGGPSASIVLEELARGGGEVFIRVGSAGGRQPGIPIGTPVILTAAYRGEGTSAHYLPRPFPAVADFGVTRALVDAADALGVDYCLGIGYTRDAYYARDPTLDERLKEAGVVAAEQEAATLFVVGCCRAVKVGAIVATDSNIWLAEQPSEEERKRLYSRGECVAIDIALAAAKWLSQG